ncbi:MAG: DUF3990 domain-containing protein [Treponema sp.]|nr:DUF3990 domain-containing protein [Treponema sp.]
MNLPAQLPGLLYHGSNHDFNIVDLSKSKDRRDFGKGFYTTTLKEQAQQWGYTMFNRFGGEGIFLYEFEFSPSPDLISKHFPQISDEWFDFILANRTHKELQHNFDYIQGPVANDKIFLTITGFIDGIFSREEAMQRLRYNKSNDQVSLHTDKAISSLVLKNKRKTSTEKIIYNGQELGFFISKKIESIVNIISEKEKISFTAAYDYFSASQIYKSLQNTTSLLWTENAEFIVDEYYREKPAIL